MTALHELVKVTVTIAIEGADGRTSVFEHTLSTNARPREEAAGEAAQLALADMVRAGAA